MEDIVGLIDARDQRKKSRKSADRIPISIIRDPFHRRSEVFQARRQLQFL